MTQAAEPKFIQISAGPTGVYALDAAGDVWTDSSDQQWRNGRWTRLSSDRVQQRGRKE